MTDTPTEREAEGTWAKLRRRKVVQWGIAYVAGAWGFLQGLQYVSGTFDWPRHIQQIGTLALLVGLPIVLVLAWYHGDRGEQRGTRTEFAIVGLLLLLGGGLVWRVDRVGPTATPGTASPTAVPAPAADTDPRPSIAVIPFQNRSRLEDDAFFVDGIHDDILTQLSKVSALRVISRTSVERFRKTDLSARQIAQQLGVTSILEGGVQRAGDRVRINLQLIDAATDAHLWAESYDRELTAANIFAIQGEVATTVARALETTLTPAEKARVDSVPTRNLEAWEAYQLGRQRMAKRTSGDLAEAERLFQRAIDLDPGFALAHVGLADSVWLQIPYGIVPRLATVARAEAANSTALALDPDLAEALTTSAALAEERDDFSQAREMYRRAIALNPNYPTAYHWYSGLLLDEGRIVEALQYGQQAAQLDPLSPVINLDLGWKLEAAGRLADAQRRYLKAIEIDPAVPRSYEDMANVIAYGLGRLDTAVQWLEKAAALDPGGPSYLSGLAILYLDLGDEASAARWLGRAAATETDRSFVHVAIAMAALYDGDSDAVIRRAAAALEASARSTAALRLLRNADLQNGNPRSARARYANAFPALLGAEPTAIDGRNYRAAIDLALVVAETGERERAADLLDRSLAFIGTIPRMGRSGSGIADVQIHALRARKHEALAALREAERSGWRGPFWRYYRDFDPNLALIRNEPEFKAIFADIEHDMGRQRAALAARPKDSLDAPQKFSQ